jgi:GNAT superfamily N-acetyltransferase
MEPVTGPVAPSRRDYDPRGVPLVLRDGSRVIVRAVRPSDKRLLAEAFGRLSEESRRRRFLSVQEDLSPSMLRYLTEIDHHDHEALLAVDPATADAVGVARYIRDPTRPSVAETAVTVADRWQGKGLGTLLLEVLAARAGEEGIERFTAVLLVENRNMLELLEHELVPLRVVDCDASVMEVEGPVPAGSLPRPLRAVLRAVHPGRRSVAPACSRGWWRGR